MSASDSTERSEAGQVAWRRVAVFYGIAFGLVALLGAFFAVLGVNMSWGRPPLVFQLTVAFLYMPMPLVAGLVVERMAGRRALLRSTFAGFTRTWWRIALYSALTTVAVYLLNLGLIALLGNWLHVSGVGHLVATQREIVGNVQVALGQRLPGDAMRGMPPVALLYVLGAASGVLAGFTINGLFAFGEEYGWRGVLMDELMPLGPVKANILTGILWGVWHAPLIVLGFNYGEQRWVGIAMMCAWLVPFSFLLWRSREYSGSLLAPAIIHGAFNGFAGFFTLLVASGSRIVTGPIGLVGALSIGVVAAVAWALTSGHLFRGPATTPDTAEAVAS